MNLNPNVNSAPRLCLAYLIVQMSCSPCLAAHLNDEVDIFALSMEDLLSIKVISATKKSQPLADAATSIYVITQQDIKNSGATIIPEALRLAPQLQVARITSSQYAISARGFNSAASNKLLVLIDGRTIYSPLFSGVFWDQQDVMLEDVERIEVISGPGATLWGSNAVNGVINIVTRTAADSAGGLVAAHDGNFDRGLRTRYGGSLGEHGHFRFYAKVRDTDSSVRFNGSDPHDDFGSAQAGFRTDWAIGHDSFTLQGDTYSGHTSDRGEIPGLLKLGEIEVAGTNLLTRWQRSFDDGSNFQLQAYWDYTKRRDAVLFQPRADIVDIEMQYGVAFTQHNVLLGGGYRHGQDDVDPGFFSTFVPKSRTLEWKNIFVQDEFEVADHLTVTTGLKLEHNDYTGTEYLPTARLAWSHSEQSLLWAAVSRAVRAPSRYDKDVYFPAPPNSYVTGGPNFESEVANVFELGYRGQALHRIVYSATAYYHDWDKLRSGTNSLPLEIENNIEGNVYGLEFWGTYEISPSWRIHAGGTRLNSDLRLKPGTQGVGVDSDILSNDAKYQGQLRTTWEPSKHMLLEVGVNRVAQLPNQAIPAYTTIDAHYSWLLNSQLHLSFTAQNLTNNRHREFGSSDSVNEFKRIMWLTASWNTK